MQNYTSDYKIYAGACIFRSAEAKPLAKSHLLPSSNSIGIFLKDLIYYYSLVHIIYIITEQSHDKLVNDQCQF